MPLLDLSISSVRNLRRVQLQGLARVNVFYGANGSGKTSVLEAVHLLGMARSFRGTSVKSLVSHHERHCVVQGGLSRSGDQGQFSLGVRRGLSGEVEIKIAGSRVRTVAELAAYLPLQVINAESFDLLNGSPRSRRQYLDWGTFHVEHRFFAQWQRFQRCIKQRNKLLRHGKLGSRELTSWTEELAQSGAAISEFRAAYFKELLPRFRAIMARLAPDLEALELRLRQGWDKNISYAEALAASRGSDVDKGHTQLGPQRGDMRVYIDGRSAADTLSRGQQKLVVCGLKLAQGQLMGEQGRGGCTYLVDDLPSELDVEHCTRVCEMLSTMAGQVFITSISRTDITSVWPVDSDLGVFHVEHGAVESCNKTSSQSK